MLFLAPNKHYQTSEGLYVNMYLHYQRIVHERRTRLYRAMLCIRGTIAMGLCPSVTVTSRSSTKTSERIELVFGM